MGAFIPLVFTAGWASGINPYLFTLLCGIVGKLGFYPMPEALVRTDVLVVVAVLALVDAVAGKIAYLDTAWDAVHTVVRPVAGAVLAVLIAAPETDLLTALAAVGGGTAALVTHAAKAAVRVGVNSSPEPASNILVGIAEDMAVAGVVLLIVVNPWVAAAFALMMLAAALLLLLAGGVAWSRWRRRAARNRQTSGRDSPLPGDEYQGP